MDKPYDVRERRYQKFKRRNPQITFAQYQTERHCRQLNARKPQNSDGAIAVGFGEPSQFWTAGEAAAAKLFDAMSLEPRHRAIEYGCGALRLAAHFIRYLERGHFLGLDVIDGYFEAGKRMLGAELLEEKAPRFLVIDDASVAAGADMGVDFVYSNLVCEHVHPDETGAYFDNLARLAHRPGARLIFNAALCERPLRYEFAGWAWPMEFYKQALPGLELVRASLAKPRKRAAGEITSVEFEFRR